MNLTDEQKAIGKENFHNVVGTTRRGFFRDVIRAGAASGAGLGAMYFGYGETIGGDPLRIGVIGTGDEGNVLIGALNPAFVQVKAIADIRPYSIHRAFHGDRYSDSALKARPGLISVYGYADEDAARKEIKVYKEDYEELLADDDIEAVIIALPLWLHDVAAIKAMRAGKHVLTEKLMAHSVHQCKEMARVADDTGLLLATGHQRHYSVLYDNAVDTIRRGVIGDIHHIRAQWHRGNLPGKDSWRPPLPKDKPLEDVLNMIRAARKQTPKSEAVKAEADIKAIYKLTLELDAWEKRANEPEKYGITNPSEIEEWKRKVAQKEAQLADIELEATAGSKYGYEGGTLDGGYERTPLEELIRWRLWDRTGGGLMAELGSHQLDASGIFISSQFEGKTKVNPLSVVGVGGRHIFPADRDVDDHVYCSYEYPAKGYFEDNDPKKGQIADENKKVVVTYSSINGNGFGGYGEVVLGTKGTLILEREKDTMLYAGSKVDTKVGYDAKKDALVDSYETGGYTAAAAQEVAKDVSRGYTEEIEHWAWCIRNEKPASELHCNPKVALADAVIALTSNIAMAKQTRIEFDPEWFDPDSDATPEGVAPKQAKDLG